MNATALLLFAVLAPAASNGESVEDYVPPPGTIGLLTPPLVPDGPAGCVRPDTRRVIVLRESPETDAAPRGEVRFVAVQGAVDDCLAALPRFFTEGDARGIALPVLESGYEEPALAVLEAQPPWFRIGIPDGRPGWMQATADDRYDTVSHLLANGLDHFTASWPGEVCEQPGATCSAFDEDENTVRVRDAHDIGKETWWQVEILTPACGDIDPPHVLATGWIPARGADGRPTVWFHSRGC